MFRYLPEQASEIAPKVDWVNNLITDLSVFFTVAICGSMLYFAIRYRQRNGVDHETPQILGSHFLEMIWTVLPTVIVIFLGYYGIVTYREMRYVPPDALSINVTAQMWKWDFLYENGKKTTGEAVIPVDKPVKFVVTSRDVLHSFFVPAMRVKRDAVPGEYNYVSFKPVKTGDFVIFCAEYCGLNHSQMMARLKVVSQADYERWYSDRSEEVAMKAMSPAKKGEALYGKLGCVGCHTLDGSPRVGPTFLKLWGRDEKLSDGSTVHVDENYIRNSILTPNKQIVNGFAPNLMPVFQGQVSDDDIISLIAFIKSNDGSRQAAAPAAAPAAAAVDLSKMSPAERGKFIYETKLCKTCHSLDGTKIVGPSFKGVYGRQEKLADGSTITVDDAYIHESILTPTAKVVEGFGPLMPPFAGQLNDDQIKDVIEFLKTVK